MKKSFVFIVVFFLIGLCLYNKPVKFDEKILFFSVENGLSFKSPFKKQTQIPIHKKDIQEKTIIVSPSNEKLIDPD